MAEEDKFWLIVNLRNVDVRCAPSSSVIPERDRPTRIIPTRDLAESELLRLQEKYQDQEFVLFESTAHAVPGTFERGIFFIENI